MAAPAAPRRDRGLPGVLLRRVGRRARGVSGGEILNLTRERIRQVEVKGLQKLRETAHSLGLHDFLNFLENHIGAE